jgi:hypothetical protein
VVPGHINKFVCLTPANLLISLYTPTHRLEPSEGEGGIPFTPWCQI